jgi:MFS family permease
MAETTRTVDPTLEKAIDDGVPETKETAVDVPAAHAPETTIAGLHVTDNVNQIEAPVTWQAYLICAFASFGGIFFGYDSGYINGVTGASVFIDLIDPGQSTLSPSHNSLIVSILSAGTFFGAIAAGDVADRIGRKWTVIIGCMIYLFGVVIQMITGHGSPLGAIVAGRLISGIGVGFESAIVILYMSEIVRLPFLLFLQAQRFKVLTSRKVP